MEYKAKILPTAWEDLKKLEDWYMLQFSVGTALAVTGHILDMIELLEKFPEFGSAIPDSWLNERGFRMMICEKQVIIYKLIEKTIYIYHIADTQRDYTKLFY